MLEPVKKTIDKIDYTALPLPARQGLQLLTKLTKMVGDSALVFAARGFEDIKNGNGVDFEVATYAVQRLVEKLDERDVLSTVLEILDCVHCIEAQGDLSDEVKFDMHFRGKMLHLFKVLQFALEVNFRDFFDAVPSRKSVMK
jgi:hypothetical protein